ncbi:hypothetical protein [Alkalispirochaeta alkalica]|uniref:hypothetical protein n=1 Tax=Alkalispirochaeta alkalica TaxID=46356 RepID=UPI0003806AB3|nr:hypothetical protein [Alkalispirochaeta alkalica]
MSDTDFFSLSHDEAMALMKHLRNQEEIIEPVLAEFLLRLERRLFAVHSIQEMESLLESASPSSRHSQGGNQNQGRHKKGRQTLSSRTGGVT